MDPVLILFLGTVALMLSVALIDYGLYRRTKLHLQDLEARMASLSAQSRLDHVEIRRAVTAAENALSKSRRANELIEKYNEWAGTEIGIVRARLSNVEDKLAKQKKDIETAKVATATKTLTKPRKVRV